MTESAWLFFRRQRALQPANSSPPECSQSSTSCSELQPGAGGRQVKVQEVREAASTSAATSAWQQLAQALQRAHGQSCTQQAGQCGTAASPPLPLPPTYQHASGAAATKTADPLPRPVKRQRVQPGADTGGGAAGAAWTRELLQAFRAYQLLYLLKQAQGARRADSAARPLLPDPILNVLAMELAKRYLLPGIAAAQLAS